MIKPFSLRGSGKCNAGHASWNPSSPAMPFMSMPLAWRRQDAIGSAHVAATPLQDAAGSQADDEIRDPWRWNFSATLKQWCWTKVGLFFPLKNKENLEWLIGFHMIFIVFHIATKDSIPECAASFWWKRRSCPVSFRIRFIQAGTASSYRLQFLELSTHRPRAGGTDVNIFGCAACDQHVSCMCAFGGIKLSLARRSQLELFVEYVFVFQCFSLNNLNSISWISQRSSMIMLSGFQLQVFGLFDLQRIPKYPSRSCFRFQLLRW